MVVCAPLPNFALQGQGGAGWRRRQPGLRAAPPAPSSAGRLRHDGCRPPHTSLTSRAVHVEIHGALVAGFLGGAVVFAALLAERAFRHRDDEQARTARAAADALGTYASAVSRNVRATKGTEPHFESGAQITGAMAQLLVLGPPEVGQRLAAFEAAGMNLGSAEGQQAFLDLLGVVRSSFLPKQPPLEHRLAAQVLFEKVHIEESRADKVTDQSVTKMGWRSLRR